MKRVLIGFTDIAHQINDFKRGYELIGYKVTTAVYRQNPNAQTVSYDYIFSEKKIFSERIRIVKKIQTFLIKKPVEFILLIYLILRHDIFHLIWLRGSKWRFYLWLIKKLNKKIVINFVGDDIRYRPLYLEEFESLSFDHPPAKFLVKGKDTSTKRLRENLNTLRLGEKYADLILSVPDQSQFSIRPYQLFKIPLDIERVEFKYNGRKKPLIIHATTEREIKGTTFIVEMIEQLAETHSDLFEFKLLEGVDHSQLLKELSNADIVIYSPLIKGTGKFGLEAMASGCLLLTGYDYEYNKLDPPPPLVPITKDNFRKKLLEVIQGTIPTKEMIYDARKWVEEYADVETIVREIINSIGNTDHPKSLIEPDFLRKNQSYKFSPTEKKEIEKKNKLIQHCSWYVEYFK